MKNHLHCFWMTMLVVSLHLSSAQALPLAQQSFVVHSNDPVLISPHGEAFVLKEMSDTEGKVFTVRAYFESREALKEALRNHRSIAIALADLLIFTADDVGQVSAESRELSKILYETRTTLCGLRIAQGAARIQDTLVWVTFERRWLLKDAVLEIPRGATPRTPPHESCPLFNCPSLPHACARCTNCTESYSYCSSSVNCDLSQGTCKQYGYGWVRSCRCE